MIKFDGIITNPPYADASHTEQKNTLWRKWFIFDKLIKENGVFAEIIPSSWMGSPPLIKDNFLDENLKISKNITHINLDECGKYFKGVGQKFSYFVYTKDEYKNETNLVVRNIDGSIESFTENLNNVIFDVFPRDLSPLAISILNKTIVNTKPIGILNTTVCHGNNKHLWKHNPQDEFIHAVEKTPNKTIFYKKQHPHQGIPKIIIPTTTYYRSMYYTENGTSQSFCYYNLKDGEERDIVLNNLNNKLFDYINECFRYSNWNSVNLLKKLPRLPLNIQLTDSEIYEFFNLTEDEISHINKIILWR
jgi:hypothetical protein